MKSRNCPLGRLSNNTATNSNISIIHWQTGWLRQPEYGNWCLLMMSKMSTWLATVFGAIAFYTCIPIPSQWRLEFDGIARWIVVVGLGIGSIVALLDMGLAWLGMPLLVRGVVLVAVWLRITGGLHLDGAMDTADGLAVLDPQRRLQVMADSHTGAFGVMAALIILLLKVTALAAIPSHRWLVFPLVAAWGRWGQLVAIAHYPYLKAEGKGKLHKRAIRSIWEPVPHLFLLIGLSSLPWVWDRDQWLISLGIGLGGSVIAVLTGRWFHRQLGGHTGDTYGAVVEWSEALLLCLLTLVF